MSIWHVGLFELAAVHNILICCAHVLKSDVRKNAISVTETLHWNADVLSLKSEHFQTMLCKTVFRDTGITL